MSTYDLTGRQWNMLMRLVNMKIPKSEVGELTEAESEEYDILWAEALEHEKKYGFWPTFDATVEIEYDNPVLDIYRDKI